MVKRNCIICKNGFSGVTNQVTCSDRCKKIRYNLHKKVWKLNNPDVVREQNKKDYKKIYQRNRGRILERNKEWRRKNSWWMKNYKLKYYLKNKDKILSENKKWAEDNPEKMNYFQSKYLKKYKKENPEKIRAHNIANHSGIRGERCQICGINGEEAGYKGIHFHHIDYSKPKEGITVCRTCHNKIHNPTKS